MCCTHAASDVNEAEALPAFATKALSLRKAASLTSQYRSQLDNERLEATTSLNCAEQELQKSDLQSGMPDIKAPTGGTVK